MKITPEIQALIDAEVARQRRQDALQTEGALFDALDRLKPGTEEPLDAETLEAVKERLGGLDGAAVLHRYLDQRYLHEEQTDYGRADAETYLRENQERLGVEGDVLATDPAGNLSAPQDIVGIAGPAPVQTERDV